MADSANFAAPAAAASAASVSDVVAQKRALRRDILRARAALTPAARSAASAEISRKLTELAQFKRAMRIAAFAPMAEEVDIWAVLDAAVAQGKTVALPRVDDAAARALSFHPYRGRDDLRAGYKGILEPSDREKKIAPYLFDFIIIPAVATDKSKKRLGYGGGFYDKVLSAHPDIFSCAAIFTCQLVERLPCEQHDQTVQHIIHE